MTAVVDCPVTELGASAVTLPLRAWCADAVAANARNQHVIVTMPRHEAAAAR